MRAKDFLGSRAFLGNSVSLASAEKHILDYLERLKKTSDMETQDLLLT